MNKQSKQGSALITFRDVALQLRDRRIFDCVDWSIRSDEHWAIIGANGSGKSVLARAIFGAVPVVGGEIEYHFPTRGESEPEDLIAHVSFEDQRDLIGSESSYYQSRWNSIEEDGALTALDLLDDDVDVASHGRSGRSSRRKDMMEKFGIDSLLDRRLAHLSNGEMRKVLIARALLQSPLILILDDPFVGLDYRCRRTLRTMIDEVIKGATRLVFVTARADDVPPGITRVLWVDAGRIAAAGKRRPVLEAFRSKGQSPAKKRLPPLKRRRAVRRASASADRAPLVEIKNASVIYDDVEVLKGINWTVEAGQNWAVLGPNGSGKSTLLSLILADNPQAYSNEVRLFGRKRGSGESIWEIKKNIGWVSPEIQIHYQKNMSCRDVVCSGFFDSVGLYAACSAPQQRLATGWIRGFGLSELSERRFDELSAGHQRMLLVARALVKNPRLLILDEPCQGLDVANRQTVLDAVAAIGRYTKTNLIYVTHWPQEIPDSVTHVLRLRRGRAISKSLRKTAQ